MVLDELISELLEFQEQGKGQYKVKIIFWSDEAYVENIDVDDKNKEIIF